MRDLICVVYCARAAKPFLTRFDTIYQLFSWLQPTLWGHSVVVDVSLAMLIFSRYISSAFIGVHKASWLRSFALFFNCMLIYAALTMTFFSGLRRLKFLSSAGVGFNYVTLLSCTSSVVSLRMIFFQNSFSETELQAGTV